jgi:O-antigen ligase
MAVALSNSGSYAPPLRPAPVYTPARQWIAGETALGRLAFGALWLFVFVMPWEDSVPLVGGYVISRWIALAASFFLILGVLATRRLRHPCAIHGLMLAFVAWAGLTVFWTIDSPMTVQRVMTYSQLLLAVWMMWELAITEARVQSLLRAYLFGASVMCVSTLVNYSMGIQAADLDAEAGITKYHDSRYSMYGVNANDLALVIALSLPIAVYLMVRARSRWLKLFCWLHIGACLVALFLVGSRGGMIAAIVGLMVFPVLRSQMPRWQQIAFPLLCAAGIALGIYFIPQDDWVRILGTGRDITQGTMTHRTALWTAGIEAFRDHAWGGIGSGSYGAAVYKATGLGLVAHNTFLSVLVEMGIPGFLIFTALLIALFLAARQLKSVDRRFWFVMLLAWGVGVSALTWEYRKDTWFLFALLIAHVYATRREAHPRQIL